MSTSELWFSTGPRCPAANARAVLFCCEADMAGWAGHTSAGLTVRPVTGGHLFAQDRRSELTAFIKADLLSGGSGRPAVTRH